VRKLLLAFATDMRVVLLRLVAQLQQLRQALLRPVDNEVLNLAQQTLDVYAPLANRLGIWQIKWELEDNAFKILQPKAFADLSQKLEQSRDARQTWLLGLVAEIKNALLLAHIPAEVSARSKHIYSIWQKMQRKQLSFSGLFDVHAVRIIVADLPTCYAALSVMQSQWSPLQTEYDDYIARPKGNGYQSLHTVLQSREGEQAKPFEVQIRTQAMHQFAEYGVAAHWHYKEAGSTINSNAAKDGATHQTQAAQIKWLRNLLAWRDELHQPNTALRSSEALIYVLTPEARVIELAQGSTPIDFAYHLHSELGHRCRGAKIDGHLSALNTPLKNGQTVEIVVAKTGGPSRDWLNPDLGFVNTNRARSKVRAWFNALTLQSTLAQGRSALEKILARIGKSAQNIEELAHKLGFEDANALYLSLGKDELGARAIEESALGAQAATAKLEADEFLLQKVAARHVDTDLKRTASGVLVVGVGALLTQLARCCKPAPPDVIAGFITRGKGVSIHRLSCSNMRGMQVRQPERVIECAWGEHAHSQYSVGVYVTAQDRTGLLRDLSELLAREKINVTAVNTRSQKSMAHMQFTVDVASVASLQRALHLMGEVQGVLTVTRQ
jgi:GTP pyrophosphokinase